MLESSRISKQDYRQKIHEVSSDIFETLAEHCGPNASYAAWPKVMETGAQTDTEFSKDGVTIVRDHLRYSDHLHEKIRFTVAYLGSKIDASCSDGTTTSMMLFCQLLKLFMAPDKENMKPYEWGNGQIDRWTQSQIQTSFETIFECFDKAIEENKMTLEDYAELFQLSNTESLGEIVYCQAMISSKGDQQLANALKEYLELVPLRDLYGQYNLDHDIYETQKKIYVKKYDYNISIPSYFVTQNLYNENLGTEYKKDDVSCLIIDEEFMQGSPIYEQVMTAMTNTIKAFRGIVAEDEKAFVAHPSFQLEKDLVLFVKSRGDSEVVNIINVLNDELRKQGNENRVVLIHLSDGNSLSEYHFLTAARILGGSTCLSINSSGMTFDEHILPSVKIHSVGQTTRLGNLYEKVEDSLYTPYYLNKEEYPVYNEFLSEIRNVLDNYFNSHTENAETKKMIPNYLRVYKHLVCANWANICAGGKTHDIRAYISVIEDTVGALNSSIQKGFVFGGFYKLLLKLFISNKKNQFHELDLKIANIFSKSISEVLDRTYRDPSFTDMHILKEKEEMYEDKIYHHYFDTDEAKIETFTKETFRDPEHNKKGVGLVQPVTGYVELTERLREILPKFILTNQYFLKDL